MRALAAAVLLLLSPGARAESVRLDDSMSQVFPPTANWEWAPFAARSGNTTLLMDLRVQVRIDTRAWMGRTGRIYMVMPADATGITANWQTRGTMLPGRLAAGERALVFSGAIPGPVLEDTLGVHLRSDSRLAKVNTRRLAFHFELDTP